MNNSKMNLFVPIEVKHREFFSKLLLSSFASKAGFRVYVGSKVSIHNLIKKKHQKGGIFFYKAGLELDTLINLKKKCDHVVILDQELGTIKEEYAKTAKGRIWPGTEKYIDRYYVIGKYGYDVSCRVLPEMKDTIRCTGWPRVDLWRKENEYLFKEETESILRKYGEYIFFSSDFGYNSEKIISERLEVYKNSKWKSARDKWSSEAERADKTLKEFNFFKKLLKQYDETKNCPLIIIRPHPNEDINEWLNFSKKLKNVKVIYEGEITPWINASSGLIHRGCTSAIQAHMRGLPVGFFVTKYSKIYETPYRISQHLFTLDQLIQFCKTSIYNKDSKLIKFHNEFKEMIYVENNKFASELIVEDLLELKTNKELDYQVNNIEKIKDLLIEIILNIKFPIQRMIKNFFKIKINIGITPPSQKVPGGITQKETIDFFKRLPNNENYIVKKIFKDCVMIERIK